MTGGNFQPRRNVTISARLKVCFAADLSMNVLRSKVRGKIAEVRTLGFDFCNLTS
jgi:hypothetical protein